MTLMSFFEECLNIHYATSSEKCKGLILSVLNIELAKFFLQLYLNLFLNLSPFHGNGNYIPCMFRKVFLVVWFGFHHSVLDDFSFDGARLAADWYFRPPGFL